MAKSRFNKFKLIAVISKELLKNTVICTYFLTSQKSMFLLASYLVFHSQSHLLSWGQLHIPIIKNVLFSTSQGYGAPIRISELPIAVFRSVKLIIGCQPAVKPDK